MNTQATSTDEQPESVDEQDNAQDIPEQWNHVANLRPQLHKHVSAHPHDFRGTRWYILSDAVRGKHLRFNDIAYEFIGRLDGDQSIEEIYLQIENKSGEDSPSRHDLLAVSYTHLTLPTIYSV